MEYEEYKQNLIQELQAWGNTHNYEISETTSQKVNGPVETITLKRIEEKVAAAIYPKALYEDYTKGASLEEQLEHIKDSAIAPIPEAIKNLDITRESIEPNLFPELISAKANEDLLKTVPHRIIADDLALVARIKVEGVDGGTILCTNLLMEKCQMTKSEILDGALQNQEQQPYTVMSLFEQIGILMDDPYGAPKDDGGLLILTNTDKHFGAAEVLNRKAMQEVANKIKGDFFCIPSSLHEILFCPVSSGADAKSLKEMVMSVNATTVDKCDKLSDSVYYYDSAKHTLTNTDSLSFNNNQKTDSVKSSRSMHM